MKSWWNHLVGGFQPLWKICSSKWVHLPQFSGLKMKNLWFATTQYRYINQRYYIQSKMLQQVVQKYLSCHQPVMWRSWTNSWQKSLQGLKWVHLTSKCWASLPVPNLKIPGVGRWLMTVVENAMETNMKHTGPGVESWKIHETYDGNSWYTNRKWEQLEL